MKPRIGINPYHFRHQDVIWNGTREKYYHAVWQGGGIPMTLHHSDSDFFADDIASAIDGLLMVGGDDISPETYHSDHPELVVQPVLSQEREAFDRAIYQAVLTSGKPILAICVGLQQINVIHGGTLHEDLPTLFSGSINHGEFNGPWVEHPVILSKDSLVAGIMGTANPLVASTHHQGIKALGRDLIATGRTSDGLIEAMGHRDHPETLVAVQWHPEILIQRPEHLNLFRWLAHAASARKENTL